MKTTAEGVEMDAKTLIQFKFAIGKKIVTVEREFSMEEFMQDPGEYGDILRSVWFIARDDALQAHRELGNAPTASRRPSSRNPE